MPRDKSERAALIFGIVAAVIYLSVSTALHWCIVGNRPADATSSQAERQWVVP